MKLLAPGRSCSPQVEIVILSEVARALCEQRSRRTCGCTCSCSFLSLRRPDLVPWKQRAKKLRLHHLFNLGLSITAWSIAIAWLYKAISAAIGLPQVPNLLQPQFDRSPTGNPSVVVIVPARNEAASVAACLQSLIVQDYPNLRILAIDDRSTDDTRAIMQSLTGIHPGKLEVLSITELPPGWLGKTHAMALAARQAIAQSNPDYLLFTDADVLFKPSAVRISLAQAVGTQADHFVTLPTPIRKSFGESMLLGYLQIMGLWAVRLWRVPNPRAVRDSMGIGAFNLLRTRAYLQIGGFDDLRMEILEDVTLGRRVKVAGLRQRVAFAPGMVNLHWASGAIGVVNVMTKNLFAAFRFRAELLVLACIGLTLLCISPALFLSLPDARIPAVLSLAAIFALYAQSSRHSFIPPWYAILFPVSATLFVYSLLRSMLVTLKDGGVTWRGTFYSLSDLRRDVNPIL